MSGSRGKKAENVSTTRHRMLEEQANLHLDLDSPNFSKDVFFQFASDLAGAAVSSKKVRGIPILPEISETRDVIPVRLTAYGTTITIAIRRDDLYLLGFKSVVQEWCACGLDNTPAESIGSKGKGKCNEDEEPFIEGAVKMHFTGSYNAMLQKRDVHFQVFHNSSESCYQISWKNQKNRCVGREEHNAS